jgi:beta-phosphoglucomutase-like phosphatase (HAD superfamily)
LIVERICALIDALIFDVDGTLAETEEAHRQAFNSVFAREGLGWV